MKKKLLIVSMVLLTVVNIVIMRANMRLGYDPDAKIKEAPEIHVYQTSYNEGTQIVFNHEMHADGYGLECIECHHVESCSHCHQKEIIQVEIEESKVALHKNCLNCHQGMDVGPQECDECHKR
jgi:class III cytochrome C family protein